MTHDPTILYNLYCIRYDSYFSWLKFILAMTYAPQRAPENARERVGGLMGTVLVAGLFAGAASSFILVPLTKQH